MLKTIIFILPSITLDLFKMTIANSLCQLFKNLEPFVQT